MSEGLRNDEAVSLATALVDHLARSAEVRALAIKGPAAASQGLRGQWMSVDVDVLVEPSKIGLLSTAMEGRGWSLAGFEDTPGIIPRHSHTFTHPLWACEVDLHHWFPGMLADAGEVFDVLWSRRTTVPIAHRDVLTGDVVVNAAICALNDLRSDASARSPRLGELAKVCRAWSPEQVLELATLAADIGAGRTLRPFLDDLGAPRVEPTRAEVVPLSDWELLAHAETAEVLPWLVGLAREPWHRKPVFLWRAIWLHDDRFRAWDPSIPADSRLGPTRARWQRLRRALRALPTALRDYRHAKKAGR